MSFFLCLVLVFVNGINVYELSTNEAANLVKQEFEETFNLYLDIAFPFDELRPISKVPANWGNQDESIRLTAIDSLSTMAIMNSTELLEITINKICEDDWDFNIDMYLNVFEIIIRDLGGLLSGYWFTKNECLKRLAIDLGERLFETTFTQYNIFYNIANLNQKIINPNASGIATAELATNLIEFGALSVVANDPKYFNEALRLVDWLHEYESDIGLVGERINITEDERDDENDLTLLWPGTASHIGAAIDSYYEYLLKCWVLFNDQTCKEYWEHSLDGILKYEKYYDDDNILWFTRVNMFTGQTSDGNQTMSYLHDLHGQFWVGSLLLAAEQYLTEEYYDLETYQQLFNYSRIHQMANEKMWDIYNITPYFYDFRDEEIGYPRYLLNPEIIESNYFLYAHTNDSYYLDRAYKYLDDIMTYCKCYNESECIGYTSILDVSNMTRLDELPSFFFAETLKYLYLTFKWDDPEYFFNPYDYVFNTEAHPIPKEWNTIPDSQPSTDDSSSGLDMAYWFVIIALIMAVTIVVLYYACVKYAQKGSSLQRDGVPLL